MTRPRIFDDLWTRIPISTHLMGFFLCISLIPCGVLTWLTLSISAESLEKSVRQNLMAISDGKTAQLEMFIRERRSDLVILGRSPSVMEVTQQLAEVKRKETRGSKLLADAEKRTLQIIESFVETYGYKSALLFDTEGNTLLRFLTDLDPGENLMTGPLRDSELAEVFDRVRTLLQVDLSDYQVYAGRSEPVAFISGPVYDPQGRITGYLALELGNREVFQTFTDYNGLGETGETVVASLDGDEMWFISPSRRQEGSLTGTRVRIGLGLRRGDGAGRPGPARLRRADRLPRQAGDGRLVVPAVVPLGDRGQAGRRGSLRPDPSSAIRVAWLLGVTMVVVILVARQVARAGSRPIRDAALAADRVAAGDLSVSTDAEGPGEVGMLLRAIRKMIGDLRSLIGADPAVEHQRCSRRPPRSPPRRGSRSRRSTTYGASTNEAAAAVNEISATSQELLNTMNEVNEVANEASRMAAIGQTSLAGMDRTMRQLADSTESIGSKLSVISERAANINLVVTTITKVADQTNLLSINAAIEAEKAGEYGLGFLVVAREIRRLADQTAVATLDIERMVKEMQYAVSAGVMEMDKFSEQVRHGRRRGRLDRRPARADHRRRPGLHRAVRPGHRGDARAIPGRRPDPRGHGPAQRGRHPDLDLDPRVQQGHRPPPRVPSAG